MKRLLFAALILAVVCQAGWSWNWVHTVNAERETRVHRFAALLSGEIQKSLDGGSFQPGPVLQRLPSLAAVQGVRLISSDGQVLWERAGVAGEPWLSAPVTEAGEFLGRLELQLARPEIPALLWFGWGALGLMAAVGWFCLKVPGSASASSGALVLELDSQRRIRRMSGEVGLLGAGAKDAMGQTLDAVLHGNGSPTRRSLSELGNSRGRSGSLVVIRDSGDARRAARRLRQLEAQYQSLCDHAHDLIMVAGPDGSLIFANRALQGQRAVTPQQPLFELFADTSQDVVRDAFMSCVLDCTQMTLEAELLLPDGQTLPVRGYFCAGERDSGVPSTILGIFQDLSAQRKVEAELRQAQKMEAVGRLAGGVAHDFNNLLTVISSLGSLMREDLENPQALREGLSDLDAAVTRAAELTRQLLLFSRKKASRAQAVELDSVVRDMARLAGRLVGEHIRLEVEPGCGATVCADRSELEQIVMNLVVNARDALPQGGRIQLTTRREGQQAVLEVLDTGTGMTEDVKARIFEPYFTTKEVGRGTGLGLSTTYGIVCRWNGRIEVESSPGQGSCFRVTLPIQEEEPVVRARPEAEPAPQLGTPIKVLVVEDEGALCRTTVKSLRKQGFDVVGVAEPSAALAHLRQADYRPQVMVTDLIMPEMNGVELAARALELRPDLKVLYVSGYPGELLQMTDVVQETFLPKPYRAAELGQRIRLLAQC